MKEKQKRNDAETEKSAESEASDPTKDQNNSNSSSSLLSGSSSSSSSTVMADAIIKTELPSPEKTDVHQTSITIKEEIPSEDTAEGQSLTPRDKKKKKGKKKKLTLEEVEENFSQFDYSAAGKAVEKSRLPTQTFILIPIDAFVAERRAISEF